MEKKNKAPQMELINSCEGYSMLFEEPCQIHIFRKPNDEGYLVQPLDLKGEKLGRPTHHAFMGEALAEVKKAKLVVVPTMRNALMQAGIKFDAPATN